MKGEWDVQGKKEKLTVMSFPLNITKQTKLISDLQKPKLCIGTNKYHQKAKDVLYTIESLRTSNNCSKPLKNSLEVKMSISVATFP